MKATEEWFDQIDACRDGVIWWQNHPELHDLTIIDAARKILNGKEYSYKEKGYIIQSVAERIKELKLEQEFKERVEEVIGQKIPDKFLVQRETDVVVYRKQWEQGQKIKFKVSQTMEILLQAHEASNVEAFKQLAEIAISTIEDEETK